jgi:hypothetical protein
VGIEEEPHGLGSTLERCQKFFRERLIEALFDPDLAAQVAGPARFAFFDIGDQSCNWFSRLGDDDLLASGGAFDQAGKLGLRLMDVDLIHNRTKLSPV